MEFVYKSLEHHLDGLRKKYAHVVDHIIQTSVKTPEDGAYTFDFADVPGDLDMREDRYLISEMLCERDEIMEADVHGYGFDLKLNPEYCEPFIVDPDSIPEGHLQSYQAVNLVASYENLLPVEEQDRITRYWGDYGGYINKHGVTDEQFRSAYAEALQAIGMSSEEYLNMNIVYRGEVEMYMRSCMMAKTLHFDDDIVFVPPSPTGSNGEWQYETGIVYEVNTANKTCLIAFEDGEATIPFRYILARFRDQDYEGNAFGFEKAEPIFGLSESWGDHLLWEARQAYEGQSMNDGASPDEDQEQGMTMQ